MTLMSFPRGLRFAVFFAGLLEAVPWFRAMPVSGDIILTVLLTIITALSVLPEPARWKEQRND
jgi:hypothetical protein